MLFVWQRRVQAMGLEWSLAQGFGVVTVLCIVAEWGTGHGMCRDKKNALYHVVITE